MAIDFHDLMGRQIEDYRLQRMLGTGGTSVVVLADHLSDPTRQAAIKIFMPPWQLTDAAKDSFRRRFLREAESTQTLKHPHIAPVLSFGVSDGLLYIIFPYYKGGDLSTRLSQQHGLTPLDEAAQIGGQIADALDYAHQHGVVHRDVKAANVLLDETGNAYLTDFGIAKLLEVSPLTGTSQVLGTPDYMAPEQLRGEPVGPAADIYALGILLYLLSTGRVPFQSTSTVIVANKHMNEAPLDPRLLRSDLPEPAAAAILKALAKTPSDRFSRASELANAFTAGVRGQWSPLASVPGMAPGMPPQPAITPIVGPFPTGTPPPMPGATPPAMPTFPVSPNAPTAQGSITPPQAPLPPYLSPPTAWPGGNAQQIVTGPPRKSSLPWALLSVALVVVIALAAVGGLILSHGGGSTNPSANIAPTATATLTAASTDTPFPTATAGATVTPGATVTATSGTSSGPGTVIYRANWSNGFGGWTGTSEWKTLNGMLVSDGTACCNIVAPDVIGSTSDYAVEARIQVVRSNYGFVGIIVRAQDTGGSDLQGYDAGVDQMSDDGSGHISGQAYISFIGQNDFVDVPFTPNTGWHMYRVEVRGNSIKLYIDGSLAVQTTDNTYLAGGRVGLRCPDGTQIDVSSYSVTAL